MYGTRQGQVTRFEGVLLAAIGEGYVRRRFIWAPDDDTRWWDQWERQMLKRIESAGVAVGGPLRH